MVEIVSGDRVLIIVPHPDDETVGCGGIIQRAKEVKAKIRLVYLTYGDANEWSFIKSNRFMLPTIFPSSVKKMGQKRHDEALAASTTLGLSPEEIYFLGYPDFSTLRIWYKHWNHTEPATGLITRASKVPYDNAYRPGAPFKGEEILQDIKTMIHDFQPTKVFTSHRLDFNPDHQALYLYVRVALWDLNLEIRPEFYPFLTHYKAWPQPRDLHPDLPLEPPNILIEEMDWHSFKLQPAEIKIKEKALRHHETQIAATPGYLLAFIKRNELFGDYRLKLLKSEMDEIHQIGLHYHLREFHGVDREDTHETPEIEFIGLDDHSILFEDNNLIETVHLTKKFGLDAIVTFYIFSYCFTKEFKKQPKYRIKIGRRHIQVFNLDKEVQESGIQLLRDKQEQLLELKFPLHLLGSPDILLINVRSEVNNQLIDWVPWRIISMGQ